MATKNSKSPSNRRKLFIGGGILVLLIAGLVIALALKDSSQEPSGSDIRPVNSVDYSAAKPGENTATEDRKNNPTGDGGATTLNTPATPPNFSVTISRANPVDAQSISVAATVNGETTDGTCTFYAKPSNGQGSTTTKTVATQLSNSSYICPSTLIAPGKGSWNISISVSSSGSTVTNNWAANPVSL